MKKRIASLLLGMVILLSLTVPALAQNPKVLNTSGTFEQQEEAEKMPRLVDRAGLVDEASEGTLLQLLDEISLRHRLDVVVVTVVSLEGKTPMAYADDFFDYNGYGFGENHDGILLLISMAERDWWISTCGYGITAFTDAGLEYISEQVVPQLSKGKYAKAFEKFAQLCDVFVTQARTGEPYDGEHMPKAPFRWGLCLMISLMIGAFTGGCVIWGLQKQLKTVHAQKDAKNYSRLSGPRLRTSEEVYLYSTMSSRPKLKLSEDSDFGSSRSFSSGGGGFSFGSTTHRSSSGRTHGGRGGKF